MFECVSLLMRISCGVCVSVLFRLNLVSVWL